MRWIWSVAFVSLLVTSGSAQDPAPPARTLTQAQVEQATIIKAQAGELERAEAEAITKLADEAARLTRIRGDRQKLNQRATTLSKALITALGGDATDTLNWDKLALNPKQAAAKE